MSKRPMIIMLSACAVVFGGIFGWKAFVAYKTDEYIKNMPVRTVTVASTTVETQMWHHRIEAVGSLSAFQGVGVSAKVSGQVESINFDSGTHVEEGTLLLQLDDTAEQAQLHAFRAELVGAKLDYDRARGLLRTSAVSRAQLDRSKAKMDSLAAQVEGQEDLVASKAIRAPFAGELGIRQVNVGGYVSPGTEIVTLQNLSPIYVDYTVPERHLNQVSVGQLLEVEAAAFPGVIFEGRVTAVSPKIEKTTRNIRLQATISNEDHRLRPGMFVQLAVIVGEEEGVLTLPQTAVTFLPYGSAVFVISEVEGEAGQKVQTVAIQRIETGRIRQGRVEVKGGLSEGQVVVSAGQLKLRNGQHITIDNSVELPGNVLTP